MRRYIVGTNTNWYSYLRERAKESEWERAFEIAHASSGHFANEILTEY